MNRIFSLFSVLIFFIGMNAAAVLADAIGSFADPAEKSESVKIEESMGLFDDAQGEEMGDDSFSDFFDMVEEKDEISMQDTMHGGLPADEQQNY